MLNNASGIDHIYIACGYTDLRSRIDRLAALVQSSFKLDPYENSLFLFCGRRTDRIKGLLWEGLSEHSDKTRRGFVKVKSFAHAKYSAAHLRRLL